MHAVPFLHFARATAPGVACLFALLLLAAPAAAYPETLPGAERSVASLLEADGSLDLSAGYTGSLDLSGYRMVLSSSGAPRFVAAAADPMDTYWSDRFAQPGASAFVNAMTVDASGRIYVGGDFEVIAGIRANGVARYDPGTGAWSPLGGPGASFADNGVDGEVHALYHDGADLYVGGTFTKAFGTGGTLHVGSVVKWNGAAWEALGGPGAATSDNGVDGTVLAFAGDGSGTLYAGGVFTQARGSGGNVAADNVVAWTGAAWQALGSGASPGASGTVYALYHDGTYLYAGGSFLSVDDGTTTTGAIHVARWDGAGWAALEEAGAPNDGVNGNVYVITEIGGTLYLGGAFTHANVTAAGFTNDQICAPGVARWDRAAAQWTDVAGARTSSLCTGVYETGGATGTVYALADAGGGQLYVGGDFWLARLEGEVPFNNAEDHFFNAVKWTGTGWAALGEAYTGDGTTVAENGLDGQVNALLVQGGTLYAGGEYETAYDGSVRTRALRLATWNGASWSVLHHDGSYYGILDEGGGRLVHALAVDGSDVYVGGVFGGVYNADGSVLWTCNVARWDGAVMQWHALGGTGSGCGSNQDNGVLGTVYALAVDAAGDVYVGGAFNHAYDGTTPLRTNRIARWNGATWVPLGGTGSNTATDNGLNGDVFALAASGTEVYAGGTFSQAYESGTGTYTHNVVRWNGAGWVPLGGPGAAFQDNGLNNTVYALLVDGSDVYAGGFFSQPYGASSATYVARLARWTGTSWEPVGGPGATLTDNGTNGTVYALARAGTDLYVGGAFTAVYGTGGAVQASRVAHWTGSAWQALGGAGASATDNGVAGDVRALAVANGHLVVGGQIQAYYDPGAPGGYVLVSGIVAWPLGGGGWQTLGSGVEDAVAGGCFGNTAGCAGVVYALANGSLYVGGDFDLAGGQPASNFTAFNPSVLPVELATFSAVPDGARVHLTWRTASETNNAGFELQRRADGEATWRALAFVEGHGTTPEPQAYRFTDEAPPAGARTAAYRLRQVDYDGTFAYSPVVDVALASPERFVLGQNYPNPFNPATTIHFAMPAPGPVRLLVFDALGRVQARLVDGPLSAGAHAVRFDAHDLPSGVYFYRLETPGFRQTRRMLLLR